MPTTLALNFAFSPPNRRAPLTGHTWAESHTCEREHVLIRSPVPAGEAALGSDAKRLGLTNLTTGLAVRGRGELRRRLRGRRDTLPRAQSEATSQTPLLPPDDEHRMHSVRQRTGGRTEGPGSPGSPPGPPPGSWGTPSGGKETAAPLFRFPSPQRGGGNPTCGAGLPAGWPRCGPSDAVRILGLQHGGQQGGGSGGAAGRAPARLPAPRAHARCPASRDARSGPAHWARLGGTTLGPAN